MSKYRADEMGADFGRMDGHQAVMQAQIGRFNSLLAEGRSIVTQVAQSWEGDAWTAYQAKQKQWDTAATDLNQVLGSITSALGDTRDKMHSTDQNNAKRFLA